MIKTVYTTLSILLLFCSLSYCQTVQELRNEQIFQESEIIDTYFKGTEIESLMRKGNRKNDLGVIMITTGVISGLTAIFYAAGVNFYHDPSGAELLLNPYTLGSFGVLSLGVLFRSQGKSNVTKARERMAASGIHYIGNTSSPELHLGTTNNGVGLILSF